MGYWRIDYRRGRQRQSIVLSAESRVEAVEEFRRLTLGVMTGIEETEKPFSFVLRERLERWRTPLRNRRVKTEPYIAALRQIGIMLDAGMPINTALEEAVLYTDDAMLRYILQRMLSDIESGRSLSETIRPFERQLGYLSLSMLELGEQTGTLADAVLKLADILEQIEDNRRQLIKATRYPVFIIFAMVIAFIIVITMVVPQFQQLFAESGMELPFPTRLLLWIEHAVERYGLWIVGGAFTLTAIFGWLYQRSDQVHLQADRLLLRVYIVGEVTHYAMLGRFIYIFDVLLHAGIPIMDALETAISVVDNRWIRQRLQEIPNAIEEGRSLYAGFKESGEFERIVVQMIKAGEDGGALNKMLEKVSKYYNDRYQYIVDNIATMIEPILIMAIAGFVLVLALGIFLPLWNMVDLAGM